MSLLLSIIEFPENCTVAESSKTFGEQGGSIGRSAENYWVLSDPDCFLSSRHSEILFEHGQYVLTDLSTNGTFLNGSREPMGKGSKVKLQDGDEIELSDYKFRINIHNTQSVQQDQNDPFNSSLISNDTNSSADFLSSDPFSTGEISSIAPLLTSSPQVIDPLAALDNIKNVSNKASFSSEYYAGAQSHSDQADALNQSIDWPKSNFEGSAIPEDWDLNDDDSIAVIEQEVVQVPQKSILESKNAQLLINENIRLKNELQNNKNNNSQLQQEYNKLKKHYLALQKNVKTTQHASVDTTMITAMGLKVNGLDKQQIVEINQIAGEMIRKTVTGMMQVLTSRSSIKNEFRMNMTTIQPVENNPLKFSANVDDALENMFLKTGSSYKKPIEAITDGFHGIAEHQIAILAGIRAAFKGAIDRFEPTQLENRFDKQSSNYLDFMPLIKKSKNWNQFIRYYNDLTDDMDNSFQYLFGDEFSQAYEDQLQKLLVARKTNKG